MSVTYKLVFAFTSKYVNKDFIKTMTYQFPYERKYFIITSVVRFCSLYLKIKKKLKIITFSEYIDFVQLLR